MAINPLIALQTQGIDTETPTRNLISFSQQAQQNQQQQEMIDLEKQGLEQQAEKDRVESALIAGAVVDDFLKKGDIEGAKNYLRTRGKNLIEIGKNPNDTMTAIEMLNEDPEKFRQIASGAKQEALRRGLIEQTDSGGFTLSPGQTRFDAMGNPVASLEDKPRDPLVNVNVGGEKFGETLNKQSAERINSLVETGRGAVATEQNLSQMADLLVEGVQTGAAQPALTSIQAVAEDFGINIEEAAKRAGVENLSNLSGKEEFDRLAKTVIIDGFEKFKGNLNDREVKLAMDAFANLGRSEEANIEAIASLRASQAIAKDRGRRASQVDTRAEAKALESELFDDSLDRFNKLKEEFESDIRDRMKANNERAKEAGVPQSAIDAGVDAQVWEAMTPEERELFQ